MPCRVAIRSALAVTEEVPEAAKSSLGYLARIPEKNSERDLHTLTSRFKLALPIPLSEFTVCNEPFQYVKMSNWAKFLLERNLWHHLAGVDSPDAERCETVWSEFWATFRHTRPNHEIFASQHVDLKRCCCLLLHGDEGRSAKKLPILISAAHSILGYGIRSSNARFSKDMHKLNYKKTHGSHGSCLEFCRNMPMVWKVRTQTFTMPCFKWLLTIYGHCLRKAWSVHWMAKGISFAPSMLWGIGHSYKSAASCNAASTMLRSTPTVQAYQRGFVIGALLIDPMYHGRTLNLMNLHGMPLWTQSFLSVTTACRMS